MKTSVRAIICPWGAAIQSQMLRPLGAGQHSWCIQYFSSLSLKVARSLSVDGGRWMNSRMLKLPSAIPEWSSLVKWRPTPSVCFCGAEQPTFISIYKGMQLKTT